MKIRNNTTQQQAFDQRKVLPAGMSADIDPQPRGVSDEPLATRYMRPQAYRVYFSCQCTGKYMRRSKRKIKWHFGFANDAAIQEGKRNIDCRGEEHVIELLLSSNSHKARVIWNGRQITHLFPDNKCPGKFEFKWQSRSAVSFHVVASTILVRGEPQYDFSVDGTRFLELPHISQIGTEPSFRGNPEGMEIPQQESPPSDSVESIELPSPEIDDDNESGLFSGRDDELEEKGGSGDNLDFRLSMIGLNHSGHEIVDELRSDLYSSTLDSLRNLVKECIPQAEGMVSRAIINAFNTDETDSQTSMESIGESMSPVDALQLEMESVREALQWVDLNKDCSLRFDIEEQSLEFMQKMVNSVVFHIRHNKLPSSDACRILISVSLVLGLNVDTVVRNDTLVLNGMHVNVTPDDLRNIIRKVGKVDGISVATNEGFGMCRFADTSSLDTVIETKERGLLSSLGKDLDIGTVASYSRLRLSKKTKSSSQYYNSIATSPNEVRDTSPTIITPENPRSCFQEDGQLLNELVLDSARVLAGTDQNGYSTAVEVAIVSPSLKRRVHLFADF